MNNLQRILGIGTLVMGIGLSGCYDKKEPVRYTTVKGKPLTFSIVESGRGWGTIACVVESDHKKVLAYASDQKTYPFALAAALIDSKIRDGDNGLVTLIGEYEGTILRLKSIGVNEYKIEVGE